MKRIRSNVALWLMILGISSFAGVYALFGQVATVEISSGLLLGTMVMLFASWFLAAAYGVANGSRNSGAVLAVGICSVGLFESVRLIWSMVYRAYDRPESMLTHWTYPLMLWCVFWGAAIMVLAPGTDDGEIPTPNKIYLLVAGMIGTLTAGIAIGFSLAQSGY